MKKYLLLFAALSLASATTARNPRKTSRAARLQAAEAAADSLRAVTTRQAAVIDSLQCIAVCPEEEECAPAEEPRRAAPDPRTPEQIAADSVADMRRRMERKEIRSTFDTESLTVIDTLDSGNEALYVVLFSDNSWKYVRNREVAKDSTIFEKYWDTKSLFPYSSVTKADIPESVVVTLVDSASGFHYPYKGAVNPRGKFGLRRGRRHQGVDLPLRMRDTIYATFCGRVRISQTVRGYGNLVIIRHDNGLETYYGHLAERLVEPNQWVEAGEVIGLGGSTGRSTGPHLHFETRYYGQSFDPERLIDFKRGILNREVFLLKRSFLSIYSNAGQDFDDEEANEKQDKQEAAERAAMRYHKIRSGDTLGHLAVKYGTTVKRICALNGIKPTTTLRIGRTLRVR